MIICKEEKCVQVISFLQAGSYDGYCRNCFALETKIKKVKKLVRYQSLVVYAGKSYKFAELVDRAGAIFVGVYDEPDSDHIDYLNINNIELEG